jgi:signal transduction histidine kinase
LITPVQIRQRIIGLIALFRQRTQPVFERNELTLLSTIADQVGLIVESAALRIEAARAAVIKERQRLARDLHDSVTQSLYSVTLLAETGRLAAQAGDLATIEDCQRRLGQTTQQALREMRLLIYELGPPPLEEHGLVGALQQRLDTVESRAGIKARLETEGPLDLDSGVQEALYRIALEALNNALKHTKAEQVTVAITDNDGAIELVVYDDGGGFDPSTVNSGMGLSTMRERATQRQGSIQFDSAPGAGTTVTVCIPHRSPKNKAES